MNTSSASSSVRLLRPSSLLWSIALLHVLYNQVHAQTNWSRHLCIRNNSYIDNGQVLSTSKELSHIACSARCSQLSQCHGANFWRESGQCVLKKSLGYSNFVTNDSAVFISSFACEDERIWQQCSAAGCGGSAYFTTHGSTCFVVNPLKYQPRGYHVQYCSQIGATLTYLHNQAEATAVLQLLTRAQTGVYMGAEDSGSGYKWDRDGSAVTWYHPSTLGSYNCMVAYPNGYNTQFCTNSLDILCQKENCF